MSGAERASAPPAHGRAHRAAFAAILAAHVVLGLAVNAITPIFEGPDEPNHFLFIRFLQLERRLPVQGTERDAVRAHHPPAYFALGALLTAGLPSSASADFDSLGLELNSRYEFRFDDPEPVNKSVFLHHGPNEQWPYRGLALSVHVARLLSLAFTTLAVALTFLAAVRARPDDPTLALLAIGLLAFNPMVVFMSGVVQNDSAALAAGAALAVCATVLAQQPAGPRAWVLTGAILASGILFKAGLLVLAGPLLVVAVLQARRANLLRRGVKSLAIAGLGLALPVASLAGWWFLRNLQLYGDLTGNNSIIALWGPLTAEQQREFLPLALYTLSTGMLGRFGNGGIIEFSRAAYGAAGLLVVAAAAGLGRQWWATRAERRPAGQRLMWFTHALIVVTVAVSVIIFALRFNGGATGKYLFPAFPSVALLLSAGWLAWFQGRARAWAAGSVVILSLVASLYAVFALLPAAYGPPRQPWPWEAERAEPLDADLGGAARVQGYRLSAGRVRPGETLRVTVYWQPLDWTPGPFTVFVHLYSPELGVIAQDDVYPGAGTYATTVWALGRPFVDTYYLHLPADAPSGEAQIVLGLYDETTGFRLPVTGSDAGPAGDWVQFGHVVIEP